MAFIEIFIISAGLSMDNMAVAAAAGCGGGRGGAAKAFETALVFACMGAVCFTAGWLGGSRLEAFISAWDHWAAFLILCYIGAKMIKESFDKSGGAGQNGGALTFKTLLFLALATNIDVLAAGISMALYGVALRRALAVLIPWIFAATALSSALGARLGAKFGKRVEFCGGLVLLLLSFKILFEGISG
jgi:putative Mn2+ efflux pump MntP